MAKLKLASSAFIVFCFLSLSYALASSDIPETTDVARRDITYDDLIVLPSSADSEQTTLTKSESESSSTPVEENLIPVDSTEANKEGTDDTSFHHHHHHHHHNRPRRSGRKEIPYGNDMILSSHENFKNSGFEEDEGFGGEDGGFRKFHHHHHRHHHHFDDGEVEGAEKEREGHPHPHGRWFHQRKFGGDEEHPFHHGLHHRRHHHHHHHDEEEHEEGGLFFNLRKFLNGF